MRSLLVALIVFGLLPVALMRPHVGILLWSWLSYMNPHRLAWGFAYSFPFAAIAAVTVVVSALLSKEPKRIPLTPVTVTWIVFVAWISFTTLFALYPDLAIAEFKQAIKIQLMVLLTLMLMGSRQRIHQLVWVIVLSLGFFGVKGGIFTLETGGKFTVWGPPQSFIAGNNEIALAIIMTLPLIRYLQLQTQNKRLRWLLLMSMPLCFFAAMSSYSRGAFLAGAAMVCMLVLKGSQRILFAMIVSVVLAAGLALMPQEWGERMGTIQSYEEDGSAMGRINAWWFAFNLAKDRPIGGGFDTFEPDLFRIYAPEPDDFHDAHSIYFEVLGEHGFMGLFLFLTLGLLAMRTGTWILRHTRDRPDLRWAYDLAAMLQVSLVGYAVGGAFLALAYWDLPYHLIAMLVLTRQIVERELQTQPAAASETPESRTRSIVRSPAKYGHRPRYGQS